MMSYYVMFIAHKTFLLQQSNNFNHNMRTVRAKINFELIF